MRIFGELTRRRVVFGAAVAIWIAVLSGTVAPVAAQPGQQNRSGVSNSPAAHYDVSPRLSDLPPAPREQRGLDVRPWRKVPAGNAQVTTPASPPAIAAAPNLLTSFEGIGQGFSGPSGTFNVAAAPPDPNGAVGPNNYVEIVNTDFAIFDKSGTALYGPVPINTLWSGFGGLCQTHNDGDPNVTYDQLADRWVISQFAIDQNAGNFSECVAVSQTGDPRGSYYRYAFAYTSFPDYPKLSIWPDAYYVTYNMFNAAGTQFVGSEVCALNRAQMLAGGAATQQCTSPNPAVGGMLAATLDGARQPPAGSPNYVVSLGASANTLAAWKFHVDWTTPANTTFSALTTMNVAAFNQACNGGTCIPQSGTAQQLDSLGDRLMYRLAYRNFGDHEALVANHSVTAGTSVGVRWYELRPAGGSLSVFQQGTYAPDGNYRWMGSIAQDQAGNMALGYSLSGSGMHPAIAYTGRLATDAAGTMAQGESILFAGGGSQSGQNLSRWGDYTSMAVDPVDNCTFWYTNQYQASTGAFNWHTRVGSFKFPNCGTTPPPNDFSIAVSPTSLTVAQGGTGSTTVSTAITSGSAQSVSFSVSGLPTGASATFNPTSVTSGSSSTLTINVGTAAAGSYTLTVTGTGASATHSTTLALTVTAPPPNDFSISVNPNSLSLVQGTNGTSTVSTAITSGTAQTVNLTVSGVPAGASASLSPTSITSGGSSTLTVSAGNAAAGSYTLTVTGSGASATHSATLSLTITPSGGGGGGITNGGFETGTLSGWTSVGTASATNAASHSGTYSAQVGGTAPTNGDSSISQTFNAPAAGGTLSGWYRVVCPDTLTYDWATATLKDNTSSVTSTILPRVCSNSGAWVQFSAGLTGGHSYTLTLISHDDNYPGDPTYTYYDDIAIVAPVVSPLQNGNFETGNLSGWTSAGSTAVTTSTPHSGTYAAMLGLGTPTNGDSSIAQTFTAPAGSSSLAFWYRNVCPDTVTYDWATATLRDNTAGTTTTVLAKTCTSAGSWIQVTAAVVAGHSYTLTLINHDDNYPGDPTYTEYDDVALH